MTPEEEKQILTLAPKLSGPVKITLLRSKDDRSRDFEHFCDHLTRLIPDIKIKKEEGGQDQLPALLIGERLKFNAIPAGTEIDPFIQALIGLDSTDPQIPASLEADLAKLTLPATLEVYVAPTCPHCPKTVMELLPLPRITSLVHLSIIDGTLFPERANENKIKAVPTIILDGQFRWTGSIRIDEIIKMMTTRDPRSLGALSLEMMVKEGEAEQLAQMMLGAGEIFPAFYDLMIHKDWSVRLGAMVVMENLIAENADLASRAIIPLWDLFEQMPDQAKGDTLYVFGEIGSQQAIPMLEKVIENPYEAEVKEAAEEALEKIN
jgi:glutaredoxin